MTRYNIREVPKTELGHDAKYICKKTLPGQLIEGEFYYVKTEDLKGGKVLWCEYFGATISLTKSQIARYLKFIPKFELTPEIIEYLKTNLDKKEFKIVKETLTNYNSIYGIEDFVDEDTGEVVTIFRSSIFKTKKDMSLATIKQNIRWNSHSGILTRNQYLMYKI